MDLIDALNENKKAKGTQFGQVLQSIADLKDPNAVIAFEHDHHSPLGLSIALSFNELQAREAADVLIHIGANADDAQVPGQKHNKAINQAIKKAQYDVALMLAENNAHMDDVVHAWMRRPKSVKEAVGQLQLEQKLWQECDDSMRLEEYSASLASLISCEVITGKQTEDSVRESLCAFAYAQDEEQEWDNGQYLCSNLDDACKVLRNPTKALSRLQSVMERWIDGIYSPQMKTAQGIGNPDGLSVRYKNIPKDFWPLLPTMAQRKKANQQANQIDQETPAIATISKKPSRRI
jgi:hypothetical protein